MSELSDLSERVAVIEARLAGLDEMRIEIRAMHDDMTRYRGFLGGVTFLFSCMGTFFMFGKDWFLSHWK